MIEKKLTDKETKGRSWMVYAVLSAVFAALTSVLAKAGISGIAAGASWLCYYYAIQNGDLSVVVPIDKMSIFVTALFSGIFLKEKLSVKATIGLVLMCTGTLAMTLWA